MSRRGFTLIEVVIAMVIAGMAISTASAIFATSTHAVDGLSVRSARSMREANGRVWLEHALAGLAVENTSEGEFDGNPTGLTFRSLVWVPLGWVEPARVSVAFEADRVRMSALNNEFLLIDSLEDATFDYLLSYGGESPWVADWRSRATAPVAVRLRLERMSGLTDTLVFFIGERR